MPTKVYVIVFSLFVIMTGCRSSDAPPPSQPEATPANATNPGAPPSAAPATSTVKAKVDACQLLTGDDLKTVQGETPKEAQRSDRQEGGFIVAQCYYALPTSSNSVVLNVTTASEDGPARSPRVFWKDTFGRKEEKGKERKREAKDKGKDGEEEETIPPEKVAGLGEDAYWIASRVGGALYVLKKDVFFRISVGGAGDAKSKLKKSKTLAQQVLKRI